MVSAHPIGSTKRLPYSYPDTGERVAVIDIGSNSVRMVIYQAVARAPVPIFNEKLLCGLGRQVASTGLLDPDGAERAIRAMRRFRAIAAGFGVDLFFPIATAAVREAKDGPDFVRRAEDALGHSIEILSGLSEAHYAGLGVRGANPRAHGIIGDMGGGSLELIRVEQGEPVEGQAVSLPLGPLRLMMHGAANAAEVDKVIDGTFDEIDWLQEGQGKMLYAIGGAWRALGRVYMARVGYPLRILHQYEIQTKRAATLATLLSDLGPETLSGIEAMPLERLETIPYAARVLARLIKRTKAQRLTFSAHGVREGVLYDKLTPEVLALDPLVANAQAMAQQFGRGNDNDISALAQALFDWMAPLFHDEEARHIRRRISACYLADIAWRTPADYRGEQAFTEIMHGPLVGVSHVGRAQIALSVLNRYTKSISSQEILDIQNNTPDHTVQRAQIIGRAIRLGLTLGMSDYQVLTDCALKVGKGRASPIKLQIPASRRDFVGEMVEKRARQLSELLGRDVVIEVTG